MMRTVSKFSRCAWSRPRFQALSTDSLSGPGADKELASVFSSREFIAGFDVNGQNYGDELRLLTVLETFRSEAVASLGLSEHEALSTNNREVIRGKVASLLSDANSDTMNDNGVSVEILRSVDSTMSSDDVGFFEEQYKSLNSDSPMLYQVAVAMSKYDEIDDERYADPLINWEESPDVSRRNLYEYVKNSEIEHENVKSSQEFDDRLAEDMDRVTSYNDIKTMLGDGDDKFQNGRKLITGLMKELPITVEEIDGSTLLSRSVEAEAARGSGDIVDRMFSDAGEVAEKKWRVLKALENRNRFETLSLLEMDSEMIRNEAKSILASDDPSSDSDQNKTSGLAAMDILLKADEDLSDLDLEFKNLVVGQHLSISDVESSGKAKFEGDTNEGYKSKVSYKDPVYVRPNYVLDMESIDTQKKKKGTRDSLGRAFATGGRKSAKCLLWLSNGSGEMKINGKPVTTYFRHELDRFNACFPMVITKCMDKYDVVAHVSGGGTTGQVGAFRHAVAKAIAKMDTRHKPVLRRLNMLKRDPRKVERKKAGHVKARKKQQWSKR